MENKSEKKEEVLSFFAPLQQQQQQQHPPPPFETGPQTMAPPALSRSQLSYTLTGLLSAPPHRQDDRALLAFRPLSLATGIAPQAAGSARCELGGTSVVVVVSTEVVQDQEAESPARISCNLDCSPAMQPGPTLTALLTHLSTLMSSLLAAPDEPSSEQLVILRSPYTGRPTRAWRLHVDATLQSHAGGNVADVLVATLYAALWDLRLPRTTVVGVVEDVDSVRDKMGVHGLSLGQTGAGGSIDAMTGIKGPLSRHNKVQGQSQGQNQGQQSKDKAHGRVDKAGVDFEVQDVWDGGEPWVGRSEFPVGVTVNVLPRSTLLDATLAEEACLPPSRRILVLSSPSGKVRAVQTVPNTIDVAASVGGEASVDEEESMTGTLPYARLKEAIKAGTEHAKALHAVLRSQLTDSSDDDDEMQD